MNNEETQKNVNFKKRTNIIDFKFQLSLISSFFKIYLISTAGFYLIVTLLLGKLTMFAKKKQYKDVLDHIQELETNLLYIFLATFLISFLITYIYGFKVTHKVSGPIYAISQHLQKVSNDEETGDLKLRNDDYFLELQDSLNNTINYLKKPKK